jgi:hypothetical protein
MIASRSVQYLSNFLVSVRFLDRVVSGYGLCLICGPLASGLWATFLWAFFLYWYIYSVVFLFVSQVTDQHGPHGSCNKTFCPCLFHFPKHSFETVQARGSLERRSRGESGWGRRLAEGSELLAEARRQRPPRLVHYNVVRLACLARRGSSRSYEVLVPCSPRRACMISEMNSQL